MIYRNPRVAAACVHLRFNYKLSMNNISRICGISTRTVFKKIHANYWHKKIFDLRHRPFRRQVKIVNSKGHIYDLKRLILRAYLYILGYLNSPLEITGDEPP